MNDRDRPRVNIVLEHVEKRSRYGRDLYHTSSIRSRHGSVLVDERAPAEFVAGMVEAARQSYFEVDG